MKFRSTFSLYKRKLGHGKVIFYYQCYDENGRRVCGHSTGQRSKTAAREYCMNLFRQGLLVKDKNQKRITFTELANGFWDEKTGGYLDDLKSRKTISKSYPDHAKFTTNKHLVPKFGGMMLDAITDEMIDSWLLSFPKRGLSHATGNDALSFLRVMLSWAVKKKYIKTNPCTNVKFLKEIEKKRELLCAENVKELFGEEWKKYWGKPEHYMINKLAACTGMRLGELMGLKGEFVYDNRIIVNGQYGKYGYTDTKNHKSRCIPVPNKIVEELCDYKRLNGDGFLFSRDGGKTPISRAQVTGAFRKALTTMDIDREEQKKRGLTFHSWRHFFNTSLLLANVPAAKVQEMTGHISLKMTRKYTQIKGSDLDDITTVQERLLV